MLNYTGYKSLSVSIVVCVESKQKFSKDINSFASKVDKRKIVEANGEWKLYKENKEVSTVTLKEAMLLFLAFVSQSMARSERPSQVPNKL